MVTGSSRLRISLCWIGPHLTKTSIRFCSDKLAVSSVRKRGRVAESSMANYSLGIARELNDMDRYESISNQFAVTSVCTLAPSERRTRRVTNTTFLIPVNLETNIGNRLVVSVLNKCCYLACLSYMNRFRQFC